MIFILFFFLPSTTILAQISLDKNWNYAEISSLDWNIERLNEIEDFSKIVWKPFDIYQRVPTEKVFLLKVEYPNLSFSNPVLFIPKTAFSMKVFCIQKKIYEFSNISQFQPNQFLGWIFHIVPLSAECMKEENLYFMLYTEHKIRFSIPVLDEKINLVTNIFLDNISTIIVVIISFCLTLFFLFLSLFRKIDLFLLYLSMFFLSSGIWLFNTNPISQFILPVKTWRLKLEYFSLYVAPIFAIHFFENVLNTSLVKKFSFIRHFLALFTLCAFSLDLLNIYPLWKTLFPFNTILITLSIIYVIIIISEIFQKEWEARILGLGLVALTLFAIHDSLQVLGFLPKDPLLMQWGLLSIFFSMSAVVGYRFYLLNQHLKAQAEELLHKNRILRLLNEEKDELNRTLEIKVVERTQDLFQKMEDLQKLKIQQDADYYLTSVLLKPLIRERKNFYNFKIESYVKQYKSFEFRSKIWELGGDIIVVDVIQIFQDEFLFFFNGDAMGKSMQGAGGAIVAGTAINHILNKRFYVPKSLSNWLVTFYEELNSVFLTFDGYMLLTACFGLLDKEGQIFWINASHPKTIIYSNRKANFLVNEKVSHEFGSNKKPEIFINQFHLKENEKFITGSDGKEEFEIRVSNKIILNENENLFLEFLENCNGNLNQLKEIYNTQVIPLDDLSILSIEMQTN